MKKTGVLLGLISMLAITAANADDDQTCTYRFAAPPSSIEPGYTYVTYFVQDVKTYETQPLKIGSGAIDTISGAPCRPFVVYATYTKSNHIKARSDIYQCPTHSIYFIDSVAFPNPNNQIISVNKNITVDKKEYTWGRMHNCQSANTPS